LVARVLAQRRGAAGAAGRTPEVTDYLAVERRVAMLEARLERLESLVEGLQDSVYRESVRHQKQIDDLLSRPAS
jgi:hypothetical protein